VRLTPSEPAKPAPDPDPGDSIRGRKRTLP
jgi:hypothetical protein